VETLVGFYVKARRLFLIAGGLLKFDQQAFCKNACCFFNFALTYFSVASISFNLT
jgi:hypothetical protein